MRRLFELVRLCRTPLRGSISKNRCFSQLYPSSYSSLIIEREFVMLVRIFVTVADGD